ncbi:MAG: class I SAM-dependent methyltransferase [Nitrosopumilus sp.]|nr:class I SAM-dependent methyltransferase [Nitrosopumilus sp.]
MRKLYILKPRFIIENILFPLSFLAGIYFKKLSRYNAEEIPRTFNWFRKCEWLPVPFHYYRPIIKEDMLPKGYSELVDPLIGIDFREEEQLKLLLKFQDNDELKQISKKKMDEINPYYENRSFGMVDSSILYSMIRHFKPKRVIEIGGGNSTKIINLALKHNTRETQIQAEHICIEPFEQPFLEKIGVKIIRERVEKLDISFFKQLSKNDILFIDSSHTIRTKGDVVFEYLNLIPSLNKGVIVHSHDIYLPWDYPIKWIKDKLYFWNEQYLLQALISHSLRYRVLMTNHFLSKKFPIYLLECFPMISQDLLEGDVLAGSFWFQIVE